MVTIIVNISRTSILFQRPFCQKDKGLTECMKDKNFCLESTPDGKHQLKRNHPYFYQVNINNFFYCEFNCRFACIDLVFSNFQYRKKTFYCK